MSEPIDLILITGYLGSGKTTLLNHLLQLPEITSREPALIVNEFGQESVDGRLLDAPGRPLFEINRGSLFCICTQTDLIAALNEIDGKLRPGLVLVEATGVAETRDLESLLDEPELVGRFRIQANICVVDAANFTKVVAFLRAVRTQIATADAMIINKSDLVDDAAMRSLTGVLEEMNPRARKTFVNHGQIKYDFLAGIEHQRAAEALAQARPDAVYAVSFRSDKQIDRKRFTAALDQMGDQLLRLKGNIHFSDRDEPEFIEVVVGEFHTKAPLSSAPKTAFTVIAHDIPNSKLESILGEVLESCVSSKSQRS